MKTRIATSYLSWEDYNSFLEYCKKNDERFIYIYSCIATYCGLRMGDMLKLRWSDVSKEMIVVKEGKTGKVREIPAHPKLREMLNDIRKDSDLDTNFIFSNRWDLPVSKQYLNNKLQSVFKASGISTIGNVSSHMFRKTFGRRIFDNKEDKGRALVLLMDIFGHSSLEITKLYLGIRKEEINEAYLGL
jgi:integrase